LAGTKFPLDRIVKNSKFIIYAMFININISGHIKFKTVLIISIILFSFIFLKCDKRGNVPTQPEVETNSIGIDLVSYKLKDHPEKIPIPTSGFYDGSMVDTIQIGPRIDTIWGRLTNGSISELSQSEVKLNYRDLGSLDSFSVDDTNFTLPLIEDSSFFPGVNSLVVSIQYELKELKRTLKIKYNPFAMYCPWPDFRDQVFDSLPIYLYMTFKEEGMGFDSSMLRFWVDDPAPEAGYIDYSDSIFLQRDSANSTRWILSYNYFPEELIEGKYKTKVLIQDELEFYPELQTNINDFYIDTTGPEVQITLPNPGSVYSPRVQSEMPIVYFITDNLEEYLDRPNNGRVNIKICDPSADTVWSMIDNGYYSFAKRVYWNFLDSDGDTCLTEGMYNIIVECEDKGGNYGFSKLEFEIDVSPP
jgi:hypothetical protein